MKHEHHILDEFDREDSFSNRYFGISWFKFFGIAGIVIFIGVYLGTLLFGENSLEVLLDLQEYKEFQENEIHRLKHDNAALQKEYFELLELDPDYGKERK